MTRTWSESAFCGIHQGTKDQPLGTHPQRCISKETVGCRGDRGFPTTEAKPPPRSQLLRCNSRNRAVLLTPKLAVTALRSAGGQALIGEWARFAGERRAVSLPSLLVCPGRHPRSTRMTRTARNDRLKFMGAFPLLPRSAGIPRISARSPGSARLATLSQARTREMAARLESISLPGR